MTAEITDPVALGLAEKVCDAAQDHLAGLQKKFSQVEHDIETTRKRIADFNDLPSSDLNATVLVNHEKSKRYLAQQLALRERLEADLQTARQKLYDAELDVDRARLPGLLAEFASTGTAIGEHVRTVVASLTPEFDALRILKEKIDELAASTGERVSYDEIAMAWVGEVAVTFGSDPLLARVARGLSRTEAISEVNRVTAERQAREQAEADRLAAMTPEEREARIRTAWPGKDRRGPPRRSPDDVSVPTEAEAMAIEDRDMVNRALRTRDAAAALESGDHDPYAAFTSSK